MAAHKTGQVASGTASKTLGPRAPADVERCVATTRSRAPPPALQRWGGARCPKRGWPGARNGIGRIRKRMALQSQSRVDAPNNQKLTIARGLMGYLWPRIPRQGHVPETESVAAARRQVPETGMARQRCGQPRAPAQVAMGVAGFFAIHATPGEKCDKRSAVTATVSDSDIMVRKAEPTVKQEGRAHLSRSYDSHPLRPQQHGSEKRGRREQGSREAGAQGRIKSCHTKRSRGGDRT